MEHHHYVFHNIYYTQPYQADQQDGTNHEYGLALKPQKYFHRNCHPLQQTILGIDFITTTIHDMLTTQETTGRFKPETRLVVSHDGDFVVSTTNCHQRCILIQRRKARRQNAIRHNNFTRRSVGSKGSNTSNPLNRGNNDGSAISIACDEEGVVERRKDANSDV